MMRPIARPAVGAPRRRLVRCGVRWLCRGVLRLFAIDVQTEGRLAPGPALLVANHLSWIDIVAMVAHYDCTFVAKDDVRRWPFIGALGDALDVVWIDRRRKRDLPRAVAVLREALQRNTPVVLFPEGTTSIGRDVLPFRSSLVEAAVLAGVPVVPIALSTQAADGQGETLCWVGEETLLSHLPRVAALREATFVIHVLAPIAAGPTRKVRSAAARDAIVGARRQRILQPAVGVSVSGLAKQNFRPMESSEREMAR